ncbi:MAG TPA: hypothetical protein VJN50_02145 [Actinomycetota bacterium]|nr:hypothetical protein [Actinomycetota bacterium]
MRGDLPEVPDPELLDVHDRAASRPRWNASARVIQRPFGGGARSLFADVCSLARSADVVWPGRESEEALTCGFVVGPQGFEP